MESLTKIGTFGARDSHSTLLADGFVFYFANSRPVMKKLLSSLFIIYSLCAVSCKDSKSSSPLNEDSVDKGATEEVINYNPSSEEIKTQLTGDQNDLFEREALRFFYSQNNYTALWKSSKTRNAFISALEEANEEGLDFDDYHGKQIREILQTIEVTEAEASKLDLLLSDAFLVYAHDLFYGRLDPTRLYDVWGITREEKDLKELLAQASEDGNVKQILEDLKPKGSVYTGLKQSLQEYSKYKNEAGTTTKIAAGNLIKPGEEDSRIPQVSQRLKELGLLDSLSTSNLYSEELQAAVKRFQEKHDLQADGIIGNSTIAELNMTNADRYNQILVNLERWRWYPRDLGNHYVLINIADFRLAVVKDGDTVRQHKVVAGRKERKTPVFSDSLQYIVINPKWHVPPTIKNKDVIPAARKDLGYLQRNNLRVVSKNGNVVDPGSINWNSNEPQNYDFIQVAGPSNPLGRVKIIYPNKYLIYLHDTPGQSLFSRSERAESSGCVRVENAIDLAAYVVQDQPEWTEEKIRATISKGTTTKVKINRPIKVHHFYWTAWRAGDKTIFTNDIYELDKNIYTLLNQS